jgi:hypothetical protein
MNDQRQAEKTWLSVPKGFRVTENSTNRIPTDHQYAIVEIIEDSVDGMYFKYVATGDKAGIAWAWDHVQAEHPRKETIRLLDLSTVGDEALPIDFH